MSPTDTTPNVRAFNKAVMESSIDDSIEDEKSHPLCGTLKLWSEVNGFAETAFLTNVTIKNWVTFALLTHPEGVEQDKWVNRGVTLLRCFGQVSCGDDVGALGRDIVETHLHCDGSVAIREAAIMVLERWCEDGDGDGVWLNMLVAHVGREKDSGLKDYCTQILDTFEWGIEGDEGDEGDEEDEEENTGGEQLRLFRKKEDTFDALLFQLYQKGAVDFQTLSDLVEGIQKTPALEKVMENIRSVHQGQESCDGLPREALISKEEHQKFLDVAEKHQDNVIQGQITTERVPKFLGDNLGIHPHLALDLLESYKIEKVSTRPTNINILVGRMYPAATQIILFAWTDAWAFSMRTHEKSDWLIGIFS